MKDFTLLERILIRVFRTLIGRKGIYCKIGRKNHFSAGTILYEPVYVGNYNYFAPYTIAYNAKIGNYCSIGPGCKLGLAEHDLSAISTRSSINNGEGNMCLFDLSDPSIVGNDVWLGANVVVRQGVKIGDGAVIGANSVVLDDIPPYAVAVGSPAKVKKYRFDNYKIDKIMSSDWFNKEISVARKIVAQLVEGNNERSIK